MHRFIKKADASLRQIDAAKSALNYVSKDVSPAFSVAVTQAEDFSEASVCAYDRAYYVLEGLLMIQVDGDKADLEPGDVCFIGKGSEYAISGSFKALVVNSPAYGTAIAS